MSDITLSPPTRSVLLDLQRNAVATERVTSRISTGQQVQSATDNAPAFFQAQALTSRVGDLLRVKDDIGQGLSTLEASLAGVNALEDITRQLQGIATAARGGSAAQRQAAAEQFDSLRQQLGNLAGDVGFGGVNLLKPSPDTLSVPLNESGTATAQVQGQASDAAGLGISAAANNFATDADIDAALGELSGALSSLRSRASNLGTDIGLLNVRERFNEDLGNALQTGADKLTAADLDEETAGLLSLRVGQQLSIVTFGVTADGSQLIANLISN